MPTIPLWELPPKPDPRRLAETPEEKRLRALADIRARAAIRLRKTAEANARLAVARKIETEARLREERAWLATHCPPTRSELEALRAMFPNVKARKP